ncbi:MAG TPA: hypothetical protein DCY27_09295 [Desulfobacterales bacterium]|nr:hypothetical protein [Desulfobacterales bacterium]
MYPIDQLKFVLTRWLMAEDLDSLIKNMRLALHDLAQPLSVVAGTVDLMLFESDPKMVYFNEIRNISDNLQSIIEKITAIRQLARQIHSNINSSKPAHSGPELASLNTHGNPFPAQPREIRNFSSKSTG